MTTLDLDMGTDVYCRDERCGMLHKVVMSQEKGRITDLIVERGFLKKTSRVVPVALVTKTSESGVYLALDREDLDSYPEYEVLEIEKPKPGRDHVESYKEEHAWGWYDSYGVHLEEPVVPKAQVELESGIRTMASTIERAAEVRNVDETLGEVDHLLTNAETQEITHVIVRRGVIPSYYVVSAGSIREIGEAGIMVDLTEEEFEALPRYEPREDEGIAAEVLKALRADEQAPAGVDVAVEQGVVTLTGYVPDLKTKRRVEARSSSVRGVVDVKNRLYADTSISVKVMSALLDDPVTRLSLIDVNARQGEVTLQGMVDTPGMKATAAAIASRQTGVQDVHNALVVEPDDDGDRLHTSEDKLYKLRSKIETGETEDMDA
jgi:osmotically-inducible protein OsmY